MIMDPIKVIDNMDCIEVLLLSRTPSCCVTVYIYTVCLTAVYSRYFVFGVHGLSYPMRTVPQSLVPLPLLS